LIAGGTTEASRHVLVALLSPGRVPASLETYAVVAGPTPAGDFKGRDGAEGVRRTVDRVDGLADSFELSST
jgi:hypothetical protein